ncbi:hypothetical protein BESB_047040 [Besnoitia besnoiti]|uniref:Uncharacterized protein n=1 Tax=Besnoitia besnoiti TaxID=94643 RepID=A0A2A9MM01_BESBE|nr:hypothetical protein BESB_047040 [Besnoitia besnoiti]PFH36512.1 hypothetical protein BESB_047040 [Besnoitia besnoiti]
MRQLVVSAPAFVMRLSWEMPRDPSPLSAYAGDFGHRQTPSAAPGRRKATLASSLVDSDCPVWLLALVAVPALLESIDSALASPASKGGSTSLCGAAQAAEAEEEVAAATHDAWGGVRRFTDALGIPENRFIHFGSAFTPAAGEALAQELLALQTDGSGLPLCLCINSSGSESLLDGSLVSPFDSDWQAAVALLRGRLLLQLPPPLSPAAEAPPRGCAAPVAAGLRPSLATVAMGRAWGTAALLLACGAPGARAATRNTSIALRFPRVSLGRGTARELRERARAILAGQRFQAELLAAVLSSGRRHPAEVQRALHVKTASLARWEGSREAAGGVTANLGEAAASGKEDAIGSFPGVTGSPRGLEPGQYSGEDERGKDRRDEREQGGRGDAEGLGEAGSCADALLALMRKGTFLTAEQAWQMGIIDYVSHKEAR